MLNNLVNYINDIEINLKEEDILNLLQIEKRWPISYYNSQASVEIINNLGYNSRSGIFNQEGYLDYIKWKHLYDLGYTTIIVKSLQASHRAASDVAVDAFLLKSGGSDVEIGFATLNESFTNFVSASLNMEADDVLKVQANTSNAVTGVVSYALIDRSQENG